MQFFTLSPAYSLICMTLIPRTIRHICGPWAIWVPHMSCIQCTVLEISCLQACHNTYTHKSVFATYQGPHCSPLCIKPLTLTNTITSPIVVDRGPHQSLEMSTEDRLFLCYGPLKTMNT